MGTPARYYSDVAPSTTVENGPGLASGTTSLIVGATQGMPSQYPFVLRLDPGTVNEELVLVTSGLGTAGTPYVITRAYGNTSAKSHVNGAIVRHSFASTDFQDSRNHEAAEIGVHGGGLFNKMYNPLEYGAVGNGVTDDTVAIQNTISAIPSTGGVLYIPSGYTFKCSSQLSFSSKDNIKIKGHASTSRSVLNGPGRITFTGSGSSHFLNFNTCENVSIEDVEIRVINDMFTGAVVAFVGTNSTSLMNYNFYMVNCFIGGDTSSINGSTLVFLEHSQNSTIINCRFENADIGILGKTAEANKAYNVKITNCVFSNMESGAIKNPDKTWVIDTCVFSNSAGSGVCMLHDSGVLTHGLTVRNCMIDPTSVIAGVQFSIAGDSVAFLNNSLKGDGTNTAISFDAATSGVSIVDNAFSTYSVGVAFGASTTRQKLLGNTYSSVSSKFTGTGNTGFLTDDSAGELQLYGQLDSRSLTLSGANGLNMSFAGAPITTLGAITAGRAMNSGVVALTDAATITTDAALGNTFTVTLAGNRTMAAPTNPTNGQRIIYRIKQDGSGSRTLTWATGTNGSFRFGTTITGITLTTTASKTDYIEWVYNLADQRWDVISVNKGF